MRAAILGLASAAMLEAGHAGLEVRREGTCSCSGGHSFVWEMTRSLLLPLPLGRTAATLAHLTRAPAFPPPAALQFVQQGLTPQELMALLPGEGLGELVGAPLVLADNLVAM